MSDTEFKEKHSRRIHQKENYVKRQVKIAKTKNVPVKLGEEHKFQDHAAMNCGVPGCVMCGNPRRIWKEKTIKEKSFDQTKEWKYYGEED